MFVSHREASMKYLVRLMEVLTNHDPVTVTNLAMLARMNHKRCNNLVRQLERTGCVETNTIGNKRFVFLTETGNEYAEKLLDVNRFNISLFA